METRTDCAPKTSTKSLLFSMNRGSYRATRVWCRSLKSPTPQTPITSISPRYIDTSEPEDLHDLGAHLNGGIPDTDINALNDYWIVFPTLRNALFEANGRPGYSDPLVETQHVKTTILTHPEFNAYQQQVSAVFQAWREAHEQRLIAIDVGTPPREIIQTLSEDLLSCFNDSTTP